jgi:malonate decarboxylase gamma subunit
MDWNTLGAALFGNDHCITQDGDVLRGTVRFDGEPLAVIGTTNHAPIGVRLALTQARAVLDTVGQHPGRAILLLIDTQGQQLRRRDELLGINRAMAHLGMAIDFARRQGHRVLGLVYDQALSGGFITSGLIADACDALPDAEIRVMRIPAMARVTKLPEAMLSALSQTNPVFAPGVANYVAMGGVRALWQGDLPAALREALAQAPVDDRRARDGEQRGGRRMAASVIQRVLDAA